MIYLDPTIEKQAYEERRHWLHSLYRTQVNSKQSIPIQVSRVATRLLAVLGSELVSLGERMQSSNHITTPAAILSEGEAVECWEAPI